VTSDPFIAIAACSLGACLTVVGIWTSVRGVRAAAVRGRVNTFRRSRSPISYWLAISATLVTAAIGVGLLYVGIQMAGALQ
jgi:hypothetical protein